MHLYSQLTFDQGAENPQQGKDSLIEKWCWQCWVIPCKRQKLDPYLLSLIKINSKWFKDLTVRPETVIILEENIVENIPDVGLGNNFFNMTPKAQTTRKKK